MITAERDVVLRPEMAEGMSTWVPNLRKTVLVKGQAIGRSRKNQPK